MVRPLSVCAVHLKSEQHFSVIETINTVNRTWHCSIKSACSGFGSKRDHSVRSWVNEQEKSALLSRGFYCEEAFETLKTFDPLMSLWWKQASNLFYQRVAIPDASFITDKGAARHDLRTRSSLAILSYNDIEQGDTVVGHCAGLRWRKCGNGDWHPA